MNLQNWEYDLLIGSFGVYAMWSMPTTIYDTVGYWENIQPGAGIPYLLSMMGIMVSLVIIHRKKVEA